MIDLKENVKADDREIMEPVFSELDRVGLHLVNVLDHGSEGYFFVINGPADAVKAQNCIQNKKFPPMTIEMAFGSFAKLCAHYDKVEPPERMKDDLRLGLINDAVDGLTSQGYFREVSTRSGPEEPAYMEIHRFSYGDVRFRLAFFEKGVPSLEL